MKDYSDIPVLENHMNHIHEECRIRLKELDKVVFNILTEGKIEE